MFLLACCATGTHGGMRQAGHSVVVDPWGTALAEAGADAETLTVDCDMSEVTRIRSELPVLRDRVLSVEAPEDNRVEWHTVTGGVVGGAVR